MQRENKLPSLIITILSLIVLGYVLFMSVYNQIVSQSDGFFNMIIFAGILLLVFVLISLIIKLMAYTPTGDYSPILKYLFIVIALGLVGLCFFMKLRFSSSISPTDYPYYKACQYINNEILNQGNDVIPAMLYSPSQYCYAVFSSMIFSIIGVSPEYVVILNLCMLGICAFMVYLCSYTISDQICGFIAFVGMLFIPGNTFAVYSLGPELFFVAIFLTTTYLYLGLIYIKPNSAVSGFISCLLAGLFSSVLVFCDPVTIILVAIYILWVFLSKKQALLHEVIIPAFSLVFVFAFLFTKAVNLGKSFGDIINAFFTVFNPLSDKINDKVYTFKEVLSFFSKYIDDLNSHIVNNYYFLSGNKGETYSALQAVWLQLGNQLIFMFIIIMSVACVIYLLRAKVDKVSPLFTILIAAFVIQFIEAKYSSNMLYFGAILIIISSATIQHMFLNHHPDVADKLIAIDNGDNITEEIENDDDEIVVSPINIERARAVVFFGENDELYEQIKEEERAAKMSDPVAATKIRTGFLDGKYISKEEEIEYFDDVDTPLEHPVVASVVAIPGTRPVETVKPILADDADKGLIMPVNSSVTIEKEANDSISGKSNIIENNNEDNSEDYYFDEEDKKKRDSIDIIPSIEKSNMDMQPEGFVFRKKEKSSENTVSESKMDKKSKNKSEPKEKPEKISRKDKKLLEKQSKIEMNDSLDNIDNSEPKGKKAKKGEHLDNPLPLPKPHVSKDFDFDVDITEDDDFDY